ncbi:MAG TPA: hypothetical protein VFM88_18230 [Vicinamibacteria bacterium]|nr:hypothetical protein [Vicinamibacteria bacterium]
MSALDDAIAALYARPLAEFTPARDALAAELRKNGAREDAARVKALPKPAVSPWAVNQLHHHAREQVAAFFEAVARLREAQRVGSADEFRSVQAERREALQALVREAEQRLSQHGHAVVPATLHRIERTLEALAATGWPGGVAGRLVEDLDPPGFDAFAGLLPAESPPPRSAAPRAPATDARAEAKARREAVERAEEELGAAQAGLREAKKRSAQAAAGADRARREQQVAQEELQRASLRAREATEGAERASFEARRAATALSEAERRVEAARTALDRLRRLP